MINLICMLVNTLWNLKDFKPLPPVKARECTTVHTMKKEKDGEVDCVSERLYRKDYTENIF